MINEEHTAYAYARRAQEKAVRRRKKRLRTASRHSDAPTAMTTEPTLSPTQKSGWRAEEQAGAHLESAGLVILERNLRGRTGEIDLVCLDDEILVFVEVRQRRSGSYGGAAASVNLRKQQRLIKTAALLLPALTRRCHRTRVPACRFDVVAIDAAGLTWIRSAFCLR